MKSIDTVLFCWELLIDVLFWKGYIFKFCTIVRCWYHSLYNSQRRKLFNVSLRMSMEVNVYFLSLLWQWLLSSRVRGLTLSAAVKLEIYSNGSVFTLSNSYFIIDHPIFSPFWTSSSQWKHHGRAKAHSPSPINLLPVCPPPDLSETKKKGQFSCSNWSKLINFWGWSPW